MTVKERLKIGKDFEEYDGVMFEKDQECKTCKQPKLARSKHCSICETCMDHFDHHCVYINKCVTRKNYLAFLYFVFSHALFVIYASWVFVLAIL